MSFRSSTNSETSNNSNVRNKELDKKIKAWQNWKPPKKKITEIYPKQLFNFTERTATIEQTITIHESQQSIKLLNEQMLKGISKKHYNYLHIGLIQVTIKPLTRQGLNTSLCATLRDIRQINYDDSLIGAIETSMCHGPVYFEGHPDLTLSLTDKHLLTALQIDIKLHGYNMLKGSEILAIVYQIHYKATNSICSKSILTLPKGETTLMKCNSENSNILIPEKIKWENINFPEDWTLQTVPPPTHNIENTSVASIKQFPDGIVKLKFNRGASTSNTPIQQHLPHKFQYFDTHTTPPIHTPPPIQTFQLPRHSTSSIHTQRTNYFDSRSNLSGITHNSNVSHGIYSTNPNPIDTTPPQPSVSSSPSSPTFSDMNSTIHINTPSHLDVILSDKKFIINKDFIRKDFYHKKNTNNPLLFFQNYSPTEQNHIEHVLEI